MKDPEQASTNQPSFGSETYEKYGGLIKRSLFTQIKLDLTNFITYIYTVSPNFMLVHYIVSAIRLLQMFGPSLAASFIGLWDKSNVTIDVITIFFHLVPPEYRIDASLYFFIIYISIFILFFILLFGSCYYFKAHAKIPFAVSCFISFFFASIGYILYPICYNLVAEVISFYIFNDTGARNDKTLLTANIVLIILIFLITFFYYYSVLNICMKSLTFRPSSFLTTTVLPQELAIYVTLVTTILMGLASHSTNQIFTHVISILTALIYIFAIFIPFIEGGFVQPIIANSFIATSILAFLMCIYVNINIALKMRITVLTIFFMIVLWCLIMLLTILVVNRIKINHFRKLDLILDNTENLDCIRSINEFINLAVDGFYVAHPVVVDFSFFKNGIAKFSNSHLAWFIFAKFTAIFPEETTTLAYINRSISVLKGNQSLVKTIKQQSLAIMRQREGNLSPELKMRLNQVNKSLMSVKQKLRHVWDMVIQGNTNEMESSTKRAFKEIDECSASFQHLFRQYPNNRFVSRNYSRYCKEILANQQMSLEMIEKTRRLQRGQIVNSDQAHELGMLAFPNAPKNTALIGNPRGNGSGGIGSGGGVGNVSGGANITSNEMSQSNEFTEDLLMNTNNQTDEMMQQDIELANSLRNRIENLTVTSTVGVTVMRIVIYLVLFIAPAIGITIYVNMFVAEILNPLNYLYHISYVRSLSYMLGSYSLQYVYESYGEWEPMVNKYNITLDYFNNSYKTRDQLIYLINEAGSEVQSMSEFRTVSINDPHIKQAQKYIFDKSHDYIYMVDNNISNSKHKGVMIQTAVNNFIVFCSQLASYNPYDKATSTINMPKSVPNTNVVMDLIVNMDGLTDVINKALDEIIQYIDMTDKDTEKQGVVILSVCICLTLVFFISATVLELLWVRNNKTEVHKCMTSLPKNVVSQIAENLRVITKESQNATNMMNGGGNGNASNMNDLSNSNSTMLVNGETTKQEDSLLKVLISGGMGSMSAVFDSLLIIACSLVNIILAIAIYTILVELLRTESDQLMASAPHLNYLQGAFGMISGAFYALQGLLGIESDYSPINFSRTYLYKSVSERLEKSQRFYQLARYGDGDLGQAPFTGFENGLLESTKRINCQDFYEMPVDFISAIHCYSADIHFILMDPLITMRVEPLKLGIVQSLDYQNDEGYKSMWEMMTFPIFDTFFMPMFKTIIPTIQETLKSKQATDFELVIILLVISLIPEIVAFIKLKTMEFYIRKVLMLLMHCPPEVVMATPKIMTILSGDFSSRRGDRAARDAEFFEEVVNNLPDAVVSVNSEMKIETCNKASERIFGLDDQKALIKQDIKEYILTNFKLYQKNKSNNDNKNNDNKNANKNINNVNNNANGANNLNGLNPNVNKSMYGLNVNENNNNNSNPTGLVGISVNNDNDLNNLLFNNSSSSSSSNNNNSNNNSGGSGKSVVVLTTFERQSDGATINIEISTMQINQKSVYLFRDVTQTFRYNRLIAEEKAKSDALLSTILPPSLVERVQNGEKDISFAVQSATIVFMDIVSFTPWCGSTPADKVMSTLNNMFKRMDSYVARYPTMTRIKCIGDCYMGAGGVFSEINQPSEHAKEVVAFGLDAIEQIEDLNKEIGESLQIRVGINTGGPIVAGVLGVGKPTFEILGPAINMAQQMEHHGVPMKVHISRSVYELIYGSVFNVKERGATEVKGGTVITYLVTRNS